MLKKWFGRSAGSQEVVSECRPVTTKDGSISSSYVGDAPIETGEISPPQANSTQITSETADVGGTSSEDWPARKADEEAIHDTIDQNFHLGQDQQRVIDFVRDSRESVFVTGRAGSGKSFLLRHIASEFGDRMIVVAPTGAAALNSGGVTVHKAFSLPPAFQDEHKIRAKAEESMRYTQRVLLRKIETLVIDEISMVRADVLNAVNATLQVARESDAPFGGVQLIAFGDPLQLPPVVGDEALNDYFADQMGGPYFFNAHSWKSLNPKLVSLEESYRQSDSDFLSALDKVRFGKNEWSIIDLINERLVDESEVPEVGVPRLTPRNNQADDINHARLAKLEGASVRYTAEVSGDDLGKIVPTQVELHLKPGAQVLMVVNDPEQRWVNGTMGVIETLHDDLIEVRIRDVVHSVSRHTWSRVSYKYNKSTASITSTIEGEFTQFPVALGWARSVHKSQGQTFEACAVELGRGGAFAPGQAYVALSRCRSFDRLYLTTPLEKRDIQVDPRALDFMTRVQPASSLVQQ